MFKLYVSVFSYAALLWAIASLPEKSWDKLIQFATNSLTKLRESKKNWPIIGDLERGQELLLAFSDCEAKLSIGQKILPNSLIQFKFYTHLLEQLLDANRQFGIGIKKCIPEIRSGLINDLQFEKKILDEILSTFLQFIVIAATTWSFVFLSQSLVQIPVSKTLIFVMLTLQIGGVCLFLFAMKTIKFKTFFKFSKAIEELYLFSSLLEIGHSLNGILKKSGILEGALVKYQLFSPLSDRISLLISRLKETGLSPKDETQEIIRQIWQLQEQNFLKFTKILQVLKFSILAFFFLPAYFLYLYAIFTFFMEQ
jgi:hypothetical protein